MSHLQHYSHLTQAPKSHQGEDENFDLNLSFEKKPKRQPNLTEKNQNMNPVSKPKLQVSHDDSKLFSRLNHDAVVFQEHNQQLKNYYSQESMKECSFQPQTLVNDEKRSLYQFLTDQQDHVNRVELKLEQIKQQEIEKQSQHPYHPTTNDYNIQGRDSSIPIYERLYNLKNKPKPEVVEPPKVSQRPKITAVSKNLNRDEPVEEILYKDAQRRTQKQKNIEKTKKTKTVAVNMKFTSNNSEKIVAQKFIREFEQVVDWIFDQTGQERPTNVSFSIDYLKLGEILQKLHFISEPTECKNERAVEFENLRLAEERALLCEVWSVLRGDELGGASKRNLCLFLLTLIGITDFKIKELPSHEEPTSNSHNKIINAHQPHDKQKLGRLDASQNLMFNFEETRKVQKTFDILYRNRLASEQLKKSDWVDTNSYKPEVNAISQQMANKYREKLLEETAALIDGEHLKVQIPENGQITHADLLVLQKKTQELQKQIKKQQLEEKQLDQCTFHPTLVTKANTSRYEDEKERGINKAFQLYQMAKPYSQKRDRTKEEVDFEKQQEECTFTPDLVNTKNLHGSKAAENDKSIIARDVDKTIQRMRDARKKREHTQQMLERGYAQPQTKNKSQNNSKTISEGQLPTFPSQQQQEEPQVQPDQERVPLLFVDVNLGPGKTERIIVFEGDQSTDLATAFAQEHGLDEFMKDKLKELLDYQISGLLTKIDEELASANSDTES